MFSLLSFCMWSCFRPAPLLKHKDIFWQVGRIAHLPAPKTPLPRAKPLPKPRAQTKWEQFAQRKGIVKKKRSKEVWDEEAGEYRRRFGYKRAGDESEVPIIEATADDKVLMQRRTRCSGAYGIR